MSLFVNAAAPPVNQAERVANVLLAPTQYLLAGKRLTPDREDPTHFDHSLRFNYTPHFILNTTVSTLSFSGSLINGLLFKGIALLGPKARAQYRSIIADRHSLSPTHSLADCLCEDWLESTIYSRDEGAKAHLQEQKEGLAAITTLLKAHDIIHWVDCGTCLGTYRHRGIIPWDEDIDLAVIQDDFDNVLRILSKLPKDQFVVQDWSGRSSPKSYIRVYVKNANWHIDIYHFHFDPKNQELASILAYEESLFLSEKWKANERKFTVATPYSTIFPLKRALFDGLEVFVPNQTEAYLQMRYGKDLRPAKVYNAISGVYEKDLSHPYWD
ncbi:MAG: hypothetical protein S4CHLAM102_07640 [Chlamydiia bacterium]|nr:hypothetical protein [Chlamydiia bacterium]